MQPRPSKTAERATVCLVEGLTTKGAVLWPNLVNNQETDGPFSRDSLILIDTNETSFMTDNVP